MTWYGYVSSGGEVTMLTTTQHVEPPWITLPNWTMPTRIDFTPPGPTPDKLVWDGSTVAVVPR